MPAELTIPILLYHRLGRPPRGARVPGQYVSPELFRRHLSFLRARGYQGVSLRALSGSFSALPAKPVVITFDDGYQCLHEHALPALAEYGFTATVFLVTGGIGGVNCWETAIGDVEAPMLSAAHLAEMQRAGLEFGSHTLHHPHLTALSREEAAMEIGESRQALEDLLGEKCHSFAYPYGDWNQSVRDLVEEAGYTTACTTVRAAARVGDDRFALPRINIRRYNLLPRFALKLRQAARARA
jgi:peptidoglycan/xylan/chitin deacetylase (PgdA/CDA1 family)